MTIQPGANVYTQGFGSRPENVEVPHLDVRAPAVTDVNYPIGKRWINTVGSTEYSLTSFSTSNGVISASWSLLGTDTGALNTLTGDSGGAISPSAGNITLAGTASQITTTGSGSTVTFALAGPYTPATYTAHGVLVGEGSSSIAATTAGTNGQVLIGSTGADPAFGTVTSSGSTITITGGAHSLNLDIAAPVTVPNGGTGATTLTGVLTGNGASAVTANAVTNHGVVIGGASNAVSSLTAAATGTVLAGSTGADPAFTASPSVTGSVTAGTGLIATTGGLTVSAGGAAITGTTTINTSGASVTSIGTGGTGAVNIGNATGNTAVTGSLTASTALTATLGAITATNGNLVLGTAGNKILSTSVATTTTAGANSFGSVTLSSGTATVATTAVTANSLIVTWRQAVGASTALGGISVGTITANTSFVVFAGTPATPATPLATDASVVGWMIIN
jgi:hypothetical protein